MRKKENKAINEIKNLESRIESLPELENSSNRIAKKFYKTKRKRILTKKNVSLIILLISILAVILVSYFMQSKQENNYSAVTPENLRAMNYEQFVDGDDKVYITGTEGTENEEVVNNVKFSTFFLRDLDGDGYAEKLKGTCKEIGKEDTLYMEIIVQTAGYLKDGKIQIDGKNFYLQTALPKDNELNANYIGNNIKQIEFENLNNGTQKLLTGIVRSGDYTYNSQRTMAIGNNINNYSRNDNKIILSGTYVDENGEEHEIRKEINIEMDWYGTTRTTINNTYQNFRDLDDRVNNENGTIDFNFSIRTDETDEKLLISKNHVEANIPEFNGYKPQEVKVNSSNVEYNYDQETSKLTIDRIAVVNETGTITSSVARTNTYQISVKYPIEAYENYGEGSIELLIPVEEYYEGYNNPNTEFTNPYKSNVAKTVIRAVYSKYVPAGITQDSVSITVGDYISNPYYDYVISKRKPMRIYNGVSQEEKDDTYLARWYYSRGGVESNDKIVLKETPNGEAQKKDEFLNTSAEYSSMENLTTNRGIYFNSLSGIISDEGEIKVYDEETGILLLTVDKTNINKYTSSNPFIYEVPVKHIRVEVIGMNNERSLNVYNIKELDDEYITNNYSLEDFLNLKQIKSNLVAYRGETLIGNVSRNALYEIPTSVAKINLNKNVLSTQITEENEEITITAEYDQSKNEIGWTNGTFLVKLPDEIIDMEINSVTVNNSNITISSYEYFENEQGKFIKILTSNNMPQAYTITINCNLTPDPRIATSNRSIELYSTNEEGTDYYYKAQDIYDVNGNLNTEEIINKGQVSISLVAPNSLLTNQTASHFDETGTVIISPNIAELKPIYGEDDREKQTVKVGVQMKNNYSSTISEVLILGKIPFEGNSYVISGNNLNSEFSTNIKPFEIENGVLDGIEVPVELKDKVTIYYSENENPNRNLEDETNGWTLKENVTDWSKIKTYIIDFGDTVVNQGAEYTFYYTVELPFGIEFNKTAYSHHGIYFSLDTDQGKYRTQTEPNRLGIRIAEKYNLILNKYHKNREKVISGATYKVSKLNDNGEIEESKTAVTNASGLLEMDNLYVEKEYTIEEVKSPEDYELNEDVVKIIGHINRQTGELIVEKLQGTTKRNIEVEKNEGEDYKAKVNVEDEVKAKLHITKFEQGTDTKIRGVKFKLTGKGLPESGRIITTNIYGEINTQGLYIGEEYYLEEIKTEGYYLASPIKFKVVENEGIYEKEIIEGTVKTTTVSVNDEIPTINIEIENEKIPTYDLKINKVEKGSITETNTVGTPIEGAKFKLYKEGKELGTYETDSEGHITINGLYQYEDEKDINQTYTLKEVYAPEGYAKTSDLVFTVSNVLGIVNYQETIEEGKEPRDYNIEGTNVTVTIEDSPSFKLVKKDGETNALLPNTKFAIYNVEDGTIPARNSKGETIGTKEIINGREYYTLTTDENGQITADLPEGLYKAVEVEADVKYGIEGNEEYFGIGASREGNKKLQAEWGTAIGGSNAEEISSIIKTTDGGYLVGGSFKSSSIELENGQIISNHGSTNNYDGMVIKYDENGECEWAKSVGGSDYDYIKSVAETKDGGIIAGGYFNSSSITVGEKILTSKGSYDGLIIKYSSTGEVEWVQSIGGRYDDSIKSLTSTEDGGIIAGGYFSSSSITVGEETLTNHNSGYYDGLIIKYSESGEVEWAKSIGGSSSDRINSVTETEDGGIIVGGDFENSIIIGEETLTSKGESDGLIIKYSESGEVKHVNRVGGSTVDEITSIIETTDGGYLVGGYFYSISSIDLGNGQSINSHGSGYTDGMLIKYDERGECEWGKSIGGTHADSIESIIETTDGEYLIGGSFKSSSIELGNGKIISNHGGTNCYDGMLIKYDKNGECKWGKSIGESSHDSINTVAEIENGGIIVGGYFENSIIIGEETLISKGSLDCLIIKLKEESVLEPVVTDAKSIGGTDADSITFVCATSDGGYIAGGYYSNSIMIGGQNYISKGSTDGLIIKYDLMGEVEWVSNIERINIESVIETVDGGYLVGGYFYGSSITVGEEMLTSKGSSDGLIIKYSSEGEVEWAKSIGGYKNDYITTIIETEDRDYLIGGYFQSSRIELENGNTIENHNSTNSMSSLSDGMIIKCTATGEVKLAKSIGGTGNDSISVIIKTADGGYLIGANIGGNIQLEGQTVVTIGKGDILLIKYNNNLEIEHQCLIGGDQRDTINTAIQTKDGGYLIGGNFESYTINLGNGNKLCNNRYVYRDYYYDDGLLIRLNGDLKPQTGISIGTNGYTLEGVRTIIETVDGKYLVGGYFNRGTITINGINEIGLTSNGGYDVFFIKCNSYLDIYTAFNIGGTSNDHMNSITQKLDGDYIVGGYFYNSIDLGKGKIISSQGNNDGILINVSEQGGILEQKEISLNNYRKQYKITTDINEIDNIKGGSISGEDKKPYEIVKYGDDSTKEIKMIPDENYEIIGIIVNGEEWQYEKEPDGSYTMPQFTNVTEDKHIVVTYALKDNKITINKVDSVSGEKLKGAEFKLDQIEERTEPMNENIIGEIVNNGQIYKEANLDNEITGVLGELTNNGTNYFVEEDGKYVPTNSRTYQLAHGGTSGIAGTATSYIPIDLSGLDGIYKLVVNANVSSRSSYDYGFVTINQSTTAPAYNNSTGRFIYITGTGASVTTPKDYESTVMLEGGQIYYLHLGYRKYSTSYAGTDQFIVNSVKVYGTTEKQYNFIKTDDNKYESTNQGKDNTVCNSYIPINLTDYSGKYNLTVNAEVSSQSSYDYGYVTITENTDRPLYNNSTGRIIYISGNVKAKDYETVLEGGKTYYLHMGYYKNGSTSSGEDKFTINSINISLNDSDLYHTTVETNSEGKAITQIPFGKYAITETKAPEGYILDEIPTVVEFRSTEGSQHEFTIENDKICNVIIHHYIKGTENKVAEDEIINGKEGEIYSTNPKIDLLNYEPEKDETSGEYVVPENAQGEFAYEDKEVIYYYTQKGTLLTVHHYIEGTESGVPLSNGNNAEDERVVGKKGETYSTSEISEELLSDEYEFFEVQGETVGTYGDEEIIVTYYYKGKPTSVLVHHYIEGTETKLSEDVLIEGSVNDNYRTNVAMDIPTKYILVSEPENKNGQMAKDQIIVTYYYRLKDTSVLVHHYLEGTYMSLVEDEVINGRVDDNYSTNVADALLNKYELVAEPQNKNGLMTEEQTVVTYYYRRLTGNLKINKVDKDTRESIEGVEFGIYEGRYGAIDIPDAMNVGNIYNAFLADKLSIATTQPVLNVPSGWTGFAEVEGKYMPVNSIWYVNNQNNSYQGNSYADAYVNIDLSDKQETECFVLSADVEMRNTTSNDWLYAWFTDGYINGNWIQESGEKLKNYEIALKGGRTYQLQLSYYKGSNINIEDYVAINMKLYNAENFREEVVNDVPKYTELEVTSIGEKVDAISDILQPEMSTQYGYLSYYKDENKYIPMSSQKYKNDHEENNTNNISLSYFEIDLENKEGYYQLKINAEKEGTDNEFLQIMLSEDSSMNGYETIADIKGTKEAEDYTKLLEGGKKYYLFFGYIKQSDSNIIDSASINSIEVRSAQTNIVEKEIGFDKTLDGKYVSNIQGQNNTTAHSVVPIDLTSYEGNLELTVNAEISSEQGNDYGYLQVMDVLNWNEYANYSYYITSLSGMVEPQDYKLELQGGKMYYLHMTYYKNYADYSNVGEDTFTINEIRVETKRLETLTTNEEGLAEITLPTNNYSIVELAPKEGYEMPENPNQLVTLTKDGLELTVENEKKKGQVTIHHYIMDVNENGEYVKTEVKVPSNIQDEVVEDEIKNGPLGVSYATQQSSNISSKYRYVSADGETSGEYTEEPKEVTYYYELKDFEYTVKYLEKDDDEDDTNNAIIKTAKVDSAELDSIIKAEDETITIAGYTYDSSDKENITIGRNTEENVITLYYTKDGTQTKTLSYTVEYYKDGVLQEKDTQTETLEVHILDGDTLEVDQTKINVIDKYEGYEFQKSDPVRIPNIAVNGEVIKIYYVAKIGKVTINHIDKNDTTNILDTEPKEGKYGETIETAEKDFDGYILVEKPDVEKYTYGENEQIVNYYYAKVSTGVLEKHLNVITGDPVAESKSIEGYEGKAYTTEPKEIEGYKIATYKDYYEMLAREDENFLVDNGVSSVEEYLEKENIIANINYVPSNKVGTMTNSLIEVKYYYIPKVKLTVKYIDILTGEEIKEEIEGEIIDSTVNKIGDVDEPYETEAKTFNKYLKVSNKSYYKLFITSHPEVLEKEGVSSLEEYLEKKNIDPKAEYVPENKEGNMRIMLNDDGTYSNEIVVTYYYGPEREVTVKYYDKVTGEEISEEVVKVGPDGDPYDVSSEDKEVEGYTLIEEPTNPEGVYEETNEPRKFYYAKNTKVRVRYVDKETNTVIDSSENYNIEGYEGKAYSAEKKNFENYNFVEDSGNTEGTMRREEIQVIYYYSKINQPTNNDNNDSNNTDNNNNDTPTTPTKSTNQTETKNETNKPNTVVTNNEPKTSTISTVSTGESANNIITNNSSNNTNKKSVITRIAKPNTGDILPVAVFSIVIVLIISNTLIAIVTKEEKGNRNVRKEIKPKERIQKTSRIEQLNNIESKKKK